MFKQIDLTRVPPGTNVPSTQFDRGVDRIDTPPASGGGGGVITHPFQLIDASDELGANLRVRYGTVNDVVPTLGGTSLSASPEAALSEGTSLVYLEVSYDDEGVVSGVTVEVDLAGTLPSFDDNTDYITLGEVDVADVEGTLAVTELRQAVTHSLRHGICARVIEDSVITESGTPYFWGV